MATLSIQCQSSSQQRHRGKWGSINYEPSSSKGQLIFVILLLETLGSATKIWARSQRLTLKLSIRILLTLYGRNLFFPDTHPLQAGKVCAVMFSPTEKKKKSFQDLEGKCQSSAENTFHVSSWRNSKKPNLVDWKWIETGYRGITFKSFRMHLSYYIYILYSS